MGAVHRTLIIINNKDDSLIYGHSISWLLSELDYSVPNWKTYNNGDFSVHFKDLESTDIIESNLRSGLLIIDLEKITLKATLPDNEEFFIEQSHSEINFNPFINLCTFCKVHFGELSQSAKNPVDFLIEHKGQFEDFKEKFHIDLPSNPHLIGTFSFFIPTRIEESFKGHDSEKLHGYEIHLHDYFKAYLGATVSTTAIAGEKFHEASFPLDDECREIACGFLPDKQVTTITLNKKIIYKSSFHLLKNIGFTTNIVSQKKISINGQVITQTISDESKFDV